MRRKLKICFRIFLVIAVTVACVFAGLHTREVNGIKLTQFAPQLTRSMGYMLESKDGKIVIIDGGLPEDASHVENAILAKGRSC